MQLYKIFNLREFVCCLPFSGIGSHCYSAVQIILNNDEMIQLFAIVIFLDEKHIINIKEIILLIGVFEHYFA